MSKSAERDSGPSNPFVLLPVLPLVLCGVTYIVCRLHSLAEVSVKDFYGMVGSFILLEQA